MKNESSLTESGQAYAAAYNAHYTAHDLPFALKLYRKLLASYPNAKEADFSRMQVQNIVNAIVPKVIPLDSGVECTVIYGFSDKGPYDRFCGNSDLALRPYPLVEGYLRNQAGVSGGDLKLIVLDADGPRERCLRPATMEAVLQAQEHRLAQLPAVYELVLDQQAKAYRLEAVTESVKKTK